MAVQVSIDPAGVYLEELLHPRRGFAIEQLSALTQIDCTHEAIGLQHTRPDHFRQAPLRHQPQADHLAQTISRMDVAHREQRIMER